tara:strand:- start:145 stop:729 length:585 start_codon:yes stop_codon:yes gene_type:complete
MLKTFKEYLGGIRLGYHDNVKPMADLGDKAPRGMAGRDSRGVGLHANADKTLYMKLLRKAMSTMPGSQKQKEIKKEIEKVQKRLGIKKEDAKRIPRKPGQKAGSDKHSDLYTDENPKGTIHGLGFTDRAKAKQSINKIKGSGKTHAHKMQAAIAMSQRAKVASQRAKDPQKKKDLGAAHREYQSYINKNKKSKD